MLLPFTILFIQYISLVIECSFYRFWGLLLIYMTPCYYPASPISSTRIWNVCSFMILFISLTQKKPSDPTYPRAFSYLRLFPLFAVFPNVTVCIFPLALLSNQLHHIPSHLWMHIALSSDRISILGEGTGDGSLFPSLLNIL